MISLISQLTLDDVDLSTCIFTKDFSGWFSTLHYHHHMLFLKVEVMITCREPRSVVRRGFLDHHQLLHLRVNLLPKIFCFNIIQGMRRVIHDLDLLQSLQQLQHLLVAVDIWLLLWHLLHLARDQPRGINHLPVLLLQQQQQLLLPQQLQQHHLLVHVLQQQQLRPRVQDIWLLH